MRRALVVAIVFAGTPALAHRLDEYLQRTFVAVERHSVQVQISLTPGVAILPVVLADIDRNGDGVFSEIEKRAYAERVASDVSLAIDGLPLQPRLISMTYPSVEEMKLGRGEIHLEFEAGLPLGGPNRTLTFVNRHRASIAAYQVNSLVPRDSAIRILAQNRNDSQSAYELKYAQAGDFSLSFLGAWHAEGPLWLGSLLFLLAGRLGFLWLERARISRIV